MTFRWLELWVYAKTNGRRICYILHRLSSSSRNSTQFKSACNESSVYHLKHDVLQIPVADVLPLAAVAAECGAEDDRDARTTEFEAETESSEVASDSANDPVIVSSQKENKLKNVSKIIITVYHYVLHAQFGIFVMLWSTFPGSSRRIRIDDGRESDLSSCSFPPKRSKSHWCSRFIVINCQLNQRCSARCCNNINQFVGMSKNFAPSIAEQIDDASSSMRLSNPIIRSGIVSITFSFIEDFDSDGSFRKSVELV